MHKLSGVTRPHKTQVIVLTIKLTLVPGLVLGTTAAAASTSAKMAQ